MRVPKVAELVANDLRRKIIRGQLPLGDTLPNEPALLDVYKVSRPTLREALRILESEGLVTIKRGAQGGQVHVPDMAVVARHVALQMQVRETTMEDLFAARRVIEPGAVRMLAEEASPEVVATLRAQLEVEGQLLGEPDAFASAATLFHGMLVERTGNNTLTILAELFVEIVDRHHHETFAHAIGFEREYTTRPTSTIATWSTSWSRRGRGGRGVLAPPPRRRRRAGPAPPRPDDHRRPALLTPSEARRRGWRPLRRRFQLGSVTPSPASSKRTRIGIPSRRSGRPARWPT